MVYIIKVKISESMSIFDALTVVYQQFWGKPEPVVRFYSGHDRAEEFVALDAQDLLL